MSKQKIEIVELALGTDINISNPQLTPETKEYIDQKVRLTVKEQEAIDKLRLKRQQEEKQKQDAIQTCFELMLENHKTSTLTSVEEIVKIADSGLNSFMLRLANYVKKRDNLWKIKKSTKDGKRYYSLTPS